MEARLAVTAWVLLHGANIAFQCWILWGGGARRVVGSIWSAAPPGPWGAEGVKLFSWLALLGGVFWLLLGLRDPAVRWMWPLR